MKKSTRNMVLSVLSTILLGQAATAYEIPQRKIDLKPYLNFMFPNGLIRFDGVDTPIENDVGIGFGLKARTQITGCWGFVVNTSITDLEVNNNTLGAATVLTVGFYYSQHTNWGDVTLDLAYGVISAANVSETLLMPSLEFAWAVSNRMSVSLELGVPIANDWFYDYDINENYRSFTLSLGGSALF